MKTSILILLVTGLLACSRSVEVRSFLPGMYVNQSEGEFSKVDDTLLIHWENLGKKVYSITRRVGFQRIRQKITLPREYQTEKWIAVYDEEEGYLKETKKGKIITYLPEKNKLYLGNTEYQKVQ